MVRSIEEETKMCQPNNNPSTQIANVLKRQERNQLSKVDSDFETARDELFNKNSKAQQLLELVTWLHESEMLIDEVVIFEIIVTKILSKEELKEYNELINNHLEARKRIKHMFEELNALLSITETYGQKWQLLKHYKVI